VLIVVTGGARSGKSRLVVERAEADGGPVVFIATCPRIEGDRDLAARIDAHRAERPPTWTTIEAEHDLAGAIATAGDEVTVIVDCLTLWVGNLIHRGDPEAAIERACGAALDAVADRRGRTWVVTNEVGFGIVPADAASRRYRDVLGRVNQRWAAAADRALFLVAGRALPLHDPVELLP
jgi:adenosylcobinamide kinase / adenosylcobinamide-phosphate guanylyltransferase